MKSIEEIATEIVTREGGYVNDPDDPGGITKHGVTIGTMRRLGMDLTDDSKVDAMDVKALSKAQATKIFVRHYFEAPGIAQLPQILHATIFDMYVNSGRNSVKLIQRLASRMGFPTDDDGIIGPVTIAAVNAATRAAPDHIKDAYGIARRNYYYAIADIRPASRKYATTRKGRKGGWILRAESFVAPKYHLTIAQHLERVAKWG